MFWKFILTQVVKRIKWNERFSKGFCSKFKTKYGHLDITVIYQSNQVSKVYTKEELQEFKNIINQYEKD